jgi:hypothetical protein
MSDEWPREGLSDRHVDDLVRRASAVPTDEMLLGQKVLARIRREDARRAQGVFGPRMAAAGFAAVLAATPLAIVTFPSGAGGLAERLILGIATGDPLALGAGFGFNGVRSAE